MRKPIKKGKDFDGHSYKLNMELTSPFGHLFNDISAKHCSGFLYWVALLSGEIMLSQILSIVGGVLFEVCFSLGLHFTMASRVLDSLKLTSGDEANSIC